MQRFKSADRIPALLYVFLTLFFVLLFYWDNQYQTPPPYGRGGVLEIRESDLDDAPIFLIDGWLLSDDRSTDQPTYIGEYSDLRRGTHSASPHGTASYRLTLRYSGQPCLVAVDFPRLSTDYVILLNGRELTRGRGNAQVIFPLWHSDCTLTVQTASPNGYYSGIYFPPVLGRPNVLLRMHNIQSFAYALAFLTPIVLSIFTFALWWRRSDPPAFWFGMLCCFYALYVAHYFVYLFQLPVLPYWNLVEGFSLYGLIFCVVRLTALAAEITQQKIFRWIQSVLWIMPLLLGVLYLQIPFFSQAVVLHGTLRDCYLIFTFCCVLFLTFRAARCHRFEYRYIPAGCSVFSTGLLLNLFFSNRFEPILFFWQFEWCGLFLVLLFGGMMASRNRRILTENAEFSRHLEQLVEKRTEELSMVLNERKAFFSDMAHDLKAPLLATQGFIREIRQNDTGVDSELIRYLDAVEQKQQEMARRVQGLSLLNRLDSVSGRKEALSVRALLEEVYAAHSGAAEVASIHLVIHPPEPDCQVSVQTEKWDILFENLIYNAIRATPAEGHIDVSAIADDAQVRLIVSDTGCGIPAEELAHIFTRFYVGEHNKGIGTGLGLYIVKSIVTEMGGEISVSSRCGAGTEFVIQLPIP